MKTKKAYLKLTDGQYLYEVPVDFYTLIECKLNGTDYKPRLLRDIETQKLYIFISVDYNHTELELLYKAIDDCEVPEPC